MKNRLKKLPPQFKKTLKESSLLADRLGFKVFLVGGVVRDLLLGKKIFDLDIVVEGDAIRFASKLAKELNYRFKKHHVFGTATIYFNRHKIDFATARVERYIHWGALPKVEPATMVQDLYRRDFTINAMAISLNKDDYGRLVDLYDGLGDLKKGLIRILYEQSFLDDPTRMLRAIRFEQRFSFKVEPRTLKLLKEAGRNKVLSLVTPHRIRDEVILILKEPKPLAYIKRINDLTGFSFIGQKIMLEKRDLKVLARIQSLTAEYKKKFKELRVLQLWLIYLAAILIKLSPKKIKDILHIFGFRKGERIIIISIKEGVNKMKRLNRALKPEAIYEILEPYSFESILFFYAYHPQKRLRSNIEYFLNQLAGTRLKTKGRDLKKMGYAPFNLYSKILKNLLYTKIKKGLKFKKDELAELKLIHKKLSMAKGKRK